MGLLGLLLQAVLLGIIAIIGLLYYKAFKGRKYFEKMGIPYTGAGYGRMFRMVMGQYCVPEAELLQYKESKETGRGVTGFMDFFVTPGVFITDLYLIRNIYVKDFDHFVNRRKFTTKGDELFKKMFLFMEGDQWKGRRVKLSPTFTTGKIRRMFDIFGRSSDRMCSYLRKTVGQSGRDVDMNDMYSKYAMDVIASCIFGVDSKTFENEPGKLSEFEEMGQLLQFRFKAADLLKFFVVFSAPKLADMLGLEATNPRPQKYFQGVIKQVLKHRRETGERHEDFLQLMMDLQEGLLKGEENSKDALEVMTGSEGGQGKGWGEGQTESSKITFDDDDIAANCTLFLLAGFDTLQSVLIFSAYAMALDQEVQQKLLEEIRSTEEENGGKLTYDALHEMKYLDMVINETLRCYPPALRTERACTKDYQIPGTNGVIKKGTLISLPIMGIHRDPKNYENPEKFDPERFLPERKSERHPYAFTPFGHGPRNCIGMRFALTEVKTVVCSLVKNFKFEPCTKTEIPMKYGPTTTLRPVDGMWLKIQPRAEE